MENQEGTTNINEFLPNDTTEYKIGGSPRVGDNEDKLQKKKHESTDGNSNTVDGDNNKWVGIPQITESLTPRDCFTSGTWSDRSGDNTERTKSKRKLLKPRELPSENTDCLLLEPRTLRPVRATSFNSTDNLPSERISKVRGGWGSGSDSSVPVSNGREDFGRIVESGCRCGNHGTGICDVNTGQVIYRTEGGKDTMTYTQLESILEMIMNPDRQMDRHHLSTLLLSYPYYTTGHQLLSSVMEILETSNCWDDFSQPPPPSPPPFPIPPPPSPLLPPGIIESRNNLKKKLCIFLSSWLDLIYCWEMQSDRTLLKRVEKIVRGKVALVDHVAAKQIQMAIFRMCSGRPTSNCCLDAQVLFHNIHVNANKERVVTGGSTGRKNQSGKKPFRGPSTPRGSNSPRSVNSSHLQELVSNNVPASGLAGIAHNVFTIHFKGSKTSFILTDTLRSSTLEVTLMKLCTQRNITVDQFVPQDLNGKILPLDILLGDIPGGEVLFLNTYDDSPNHVTIKFFDGDNIHTLDRVDCQEDMELYILLENQFGLQTEDIVVELSSGKVLPTEVRLRSVKGEDIFVYRKKNDEPSEVKDQRPSRKKLGIRLNVFSDSFRGLPEELITKRKELLGDINRKSPLHSLKPVVIYPTFKHQYSPHPLAAFPKLKIT
eukprot:TRINITY_DN8152_c0_g4_i1.p1 TRINITY_DN8152_c0_g4~~TRINITY_DN8152_c0_g4_i1.p1  ORF type:complete len:657 (-),score=116.80 TRINITY_DN8152_c0_g4_i1:126-2096(-)